MLYETAARANEVLRLDVGEVDRTSRTRLASALELLTFDSEALHGIPL